MWCRCPLRRTTPDSGKDETSKHSGTGACPSPSNSKPARAMGNADA